MDFEYFIDNMKEKFKFDVGDIVEDGLYKYSIEARIYDIDQDEYYYLIFGGIRVKQKHIDEQYRICG